MVLTQSVTQVVFLPQEYKSGSVSYPLVVNPWIKYTLTLIRLETNSHKVKMRKLADGSNLRILFLIVLATPYSLSADSSIPLETTASLYF